MVPVPALPAPTDHYRELFEQIGAVQLLVDPASMQIVDANPAAAAFYGYSRLALRGMPVSGLNTLPPEEVRQAVQLAASMGGHYRGFPHRLASGEIRLVEIYAGPLQLEGRVLLHEIVHDVTEQIQLERAREEAGAHARNLGAVAVGVAHEVRNPLFGISSTLDAFRARFGDRPEFQPYLQVLGEQVDRLSRLMQDLLEYGKPPRPRLAPGDPAAAVAAALRHSAALARERQVTLVQETDDARGTISMDPARLPQLFQNLVENAMQHSPAGGRVVVRLAAAPNAGSPAIEISVTDEGTGFSTEDLPYVFEPFYTRRPGGTGLGLAIARRIVDEHGGEITAANQPHGGAVVRVRLPVLTG